MDWQNGLVEESKNKRPTCRGCQCECCRSQIVYIKQFDVFNKFLNSLVATKDGEHNLLETTQVLYGTCMGSANSHSNVNLPVLLAGGGFKHGQHLAFDKNKNYNLATLYVTMLQRLGLPANGFASATSTMRGLDMA